MQASPPPFTAAFHHLHQLHPQLQQPDVSQKRKYLSLLPLEQIVGLCLALDAQIPPYLKASIWPGDLTAAIAQLEAAKTVQEPPVMDSLSQQASPSPTSTPRTSPEPAPPIPQSGTEPKPPERTSQTPAPAPAPAPPAQSPTPAPPAAANASGPTTPTAAEATSPRPPLPATATSIATPISVAATTSTPAPQPPRAVPTPQPLAVPSYAHHQPYGFGNTTYPHHTPYYQTQHTWSYAPPPGYAYPHHHHAIPPHPSTSAVAVAPQPPQPPQPPPQPHTHTPYVPFSATPHPPQPPPDPYIGTLEDMPSYEEMIVEALAECTEPDGLMAPKDLFNRMAAKYPLQSNFRPSASQALQRAFKRGRFEKSSSGKYRLNPRWEGGNTTRKTTRRPQTLEAHATANSTQARGSPFTRSPLNRSSEAAAAVPAYSYAAYMAQFAPNRRTNNTPQQQQEKDKEKEQMTDAEAAQHILKTINLEDLLKMTAGGLEDMAESSSSQQTQPSHLGQAGASGSSHALGAAGKRPQQQQAGPADRAQLQVQLALLAAQLIQFGQDDEEGQEKPQQDQQSTQQEPEPSPHEPSGAVLSCDENQQQAEKSPDLPPQSQPELSLSQTPVINGDTQDPPSLTGTDQQPAPVVKPVASDAETSDDDSDDMEEIISSPTNGVAPVSTPVSASMQSPPLPPTTALAAPPVFAFSMPPLFAMANGGIFGGVPPQPQAQSTPDDGTASVAPTAEPSNSVLAAGSGGGSGAAAESILDDAGEDESEDDDDMEAVI